MLGNHFVILTDHKAIISPLKTNRGNKTHQSRLTRWADRLLPFDFDIFHISGGKLGIVDYLSRYPTFEAPRPSNFDEQYVVKCINRFFEACDFLDEWANYHSLSKEVPDITKISQNSVVSDNINLMKSLDISQSRVTCSELDNLIVSSNKFRTLSVEGALIQNNPSTLHKVKPIEGDKILASEQIELSHQFNKSVLSPLEGVQIVGSNSGQSALRKFMPTFVTFSAWFPFYLPVLISLWFITLVVSNVDLLSSLIQFFASVLLYSICWNATGLLGAFLVQTAMNPNTRNTSANNTNDSFEQLLNQYPPVHQHWFSSDRARPRFRAGAVRPIWSSTVQRGVELKNQFARILANFRSKRAKKTTIAKQHSQSVQSLEILKAPVVAKDQKSITGLVGILDSDVLSELTDEDASLYLMKRAIVNRDYEGFCRIDP